MDLSYNQIQGTVPNWIWELGNGSLFHLNLSSNNLVSLQEAYALPSFLNVLDLNSNKIHGKIPVLPPDLSYEDLSHNNFTSFILADIGNRLSYLSFYSLSNNGITGVIPESICNASYLHVLDLSYNHLSDKIPPCMPKMTDRLGVLNLRRNNFIGQVHYSFPGNFSLKTLDLNGNFIEGHLPKSLANSSSLEVFDLGHNKIIYQFPCLLKKLSTLRVLVLQSKKFYGSIECANSNIIWWMLQIIDLAHNNFRGKLPVQWFTNLQAMKAKVKDDVLSQFNHLNFKFLRFSQVYYQDGVTVITLE